LHVLALPCRHCAARWCRGGPRTLIGWVTNFAWSRASWPHQRPGYQHPSGGRLHPSTQVR
jgi:hypothetical protein